jgi:hypothetical protein
MEMKHHARTLPRSSPAPTGLVVLIIAQTVLGTGACGGTSPNGEAPTEVHIAAAEPRATDAAAAAFPLAQLRAGLRTRYVGEGDDSPPDPPPPGVFDLIHYAAPLGRNAAYVTPPAAAGTSARKPAIIWVSGGFNWGIDRGAWTPEPRANDQSATTFLHAGLVLMRPSLRGRNGNPGQPECFVGEVDDIIAAGEYLRTRPDVDPNRIYLGGHSTGGHAGAPDRRQHRPLPRHLRLWRRARRPRLRGPRVHPV